MGIFDKFKKRKEIKEKPEKEILKVKPVEKPESKEIKPQPKEKIEKVKKKPQKEDTGEAYRLLIRPTVTEKASGLGMYGQYVFEVHPQANKIEIKKAIENVYGVRPVSVNIIKVKGKQVRYGRSQGQTKNWKKAVITLKPGDKIELVEGV